MTNINIIEEFESCIVVESIDREFDDSNYNDPNILQGEMKILEDAESPEEFKADNKGLTREKFYPNQPSTWLLNTHPNGYFDGLRQILKDDDPIFNSNLLTKLPLKNHTTQNINPADYKPANNLNKQHINQKLNENKDTIKSTSIKPENITPTNIKPANIEQINNTFSHNMPQKIKFVILGNELAPWLEPKLAKYRFFFTMLYLILFGASIYAGTQNLYPQHILVLTCVIGFVVIYLIKSVILYLLKKATIYNRKKAYLDSEKDIHPEVYKALKRGKYSELMTPKELELVQGLCVYTKTKNDKTVYHLGNNNF